MLSPAWTTDWLTDEARAKLERVRRGPARRAASAATAPVLLTLSVRCPQCGSTDTRESSRFGSTACKSLWVAAAAASRSTTSRRSEEGRGLRPMALHATFHTSAVAAIREP